MTPCDLESRRLATIKRKTVFFSLKTSGGRTLLSRGWDTVVPPRGCWPLGQLVLAEIVGGGHLVAHAVAGVAVLSDELLHGGGLGGAAGGGGVAPEEEVWHLRRRCGT